MANTVVGLIGDIQAAQSLVHHLVANGIRREAIGFRGDPGHALPGTAALNESEGSIESRAILVAVAAQTDDQAQNVVALMRRHGAADVDRRETEE